ncbi:MAG: 50S ribosomal protein L6 [Planctomycetes bacterium]|jgi:large subunit ribosomal protein L6|nr:50S ribosomal protein L6 [Planctomycetota bacterium]MBT4028274.1 50S ribosomal protein L6 [Planctomycetota bacterium]MBT4560933.1 50S ribosomal protein L6 [Planctomycetota bacterium]MBT5101308.1 50S ribosomal protein L6 [Planctomycetota bacterium]MBT7012787.1 50S ribosomal protein L6 [Planctomycetota bacterium]
MSRIGVQAVVLPSGVSVEVSADKFEVKGAKGSLTFPLFTEIAIEQEDNVVRVVRTGAGSSSKASAFHGLVRAHLANMVEGVTNGYTKTLQILGTGWNAKPMGKGIELQIGFCHPVQCDPPEGVEVSLTSPTEIVVAGADKHQVGQFAANIRRVRPPEPYKGKGIRYKGEQVRRKVGKSLA